MDVGPITTRRALYGSAPNLTAVLAICQLKGGCRVSVSARAECGPPVQRGLYTAKADRSLRASATENRKTGSRRPCGYRESQLPPSALPKMGTWSAEGVGWIPGTVPGRPTASLALVDRVAAAPGVELQQPPLPGDQCLRTSPREGQTFSTPTGSPALPRLYSAPRWWIDAAAPGTET